MSQISCWCSCMCVPDSCCCILHQWLLLLLMITEKRREQAINCMCICACTVVQIAAVTSFKLAYVAANMTRNDHLNLMDIHMRNLLPYLMFNCLVHLNNSVAITLTQKSLPFWPVLQRYAFGCYLILQGLPFPRNPRELCKQQQPSAYEHLWKARIKQGIDL